jgi:hypothetical protein
MLYFESKNNNLKNMNTKTATNDLGFPESWKQEHNDSMIYSDALFHLCLDKVYHHFTLDIFEKLSLFWMTARKSDDEVLINFNTWQQYCITHESSLTKSKVLIYKLSDWFSSSDERKLVWTCEPIYEKIMDKIVSDLSVSKITDPTRKKIDNTIRFFK